MRRTDTALLKEASSLTLRIRDMTMPRSIGHRREVISQQNMTRKAAAATEGALDED